MFAAFKEPYVHHRRIVGRVDIIFDILPRKKHNKYDWFAQVILFLS